MSLAKLIQSIGHFFANLFAHTKEDFNNLPKDQQDAIIQGVNLSQLIKDGYKEGEAALVANVAAKLNISTDVAKGLILYTLKSLGINVTVIQDGLNQLADRIQAGITDEGWNGLWQVAAQSAASWLSTGSLNWITLGLGVVEFVVQHFLKGIK
ncbi:hypothetical protein [Mucilaginibacter sp. 10I4]|uniref:hypothetical protein n=1 Tax=Mucilaginibacter sp. 10I4 TaxID=3048580 RepID=UPI002B227AAB|nr:hypothetical protein [Mucilaginibacter sp. 10I4]MEB0262287.1 hypothetical protein [Mucilaginibacter sp. 10I4]